MSGRYIFSQLSDYLEEALSCCVQGDHIDAISKLKYSNKFQRRYGPGHTSDEVLEVKHIMPLPKQKAAANLRTYSSLTL